ncbi:FtsK/SpoIIIE family DNA translocase [Paenibacillus koleovorans]|uniref:FtsK/SpoIIIE family DNA translocase n=1 Tax=Paenibacillus koleovorans TaxID=121608 RepID=UPI000FD83815|nr:DNA translocase FtsK [Paenibacillus koleovorans]
MAKRRKKNGSLSVQLKYELYGILILIFSIIALSKQGSVARSLTYLFRFFIGVFDWVIPVIFIYIGLYAMIRRGWPQRWSARKTGIVLVLCGFLIMNHITMFQQLDPYEQFLSTKWILSQTWTSLIDGLNPTAQGAEILSTQVGGGMIGAILYAILYMLFDNTGAKLIEYTMFAIGFVLITGFSYVDMGGKLSTLFRGTGLHVREQLKDLVLLLRGRPKPKIKVKQTKAVPIYVPLHDDDLDDEEELPVITREKKKPIFFQMFGGKRAGSGTAATANRPSTVPGDGEDEDDFGGEVVVGLGTVVRPVVQEHEPDQPEMPVIRNFQEQVEPAADGPIHASWVTPPKKQEPAAAAAKSRAKTKEEPPDESEMAFQGEGDEGGGTASAPATPYELPSLHLLSRPAGAGKGSEQTDYMVVAKKLESTLESFGVRTKVLEVVRGPAVTRYEIQPDVGVKVSRIVSLTDDIALALAAKDIRMEAPIPGKSAIGIEVPNTEVSVVTMREVMESLVFRDSSSKLSIAFGRDIAGQAIVGNLARMPHLLVAGATGSGKSVCINGIITSILYKAKPDEVKFLMIDPKMVELNVYNGIPHLLAPVVTDPRRASLALKKVVVEMEKRYELFSKSGTRNIEGYNAMLIEKKEGAPLPYIVVIVDELADLMMVAAGDVEDAICRLAQMARAAGIHLIIATQRPSVDVITGVIKANIPSRIAFGVSSQVDSRTILDMVGAEKLLGRGDMLFLPMGASKPIRVQGAFLSDAEVESVVSYVSHQEQARYQEELVPEIDDSADAADEYEDELFDQAVQIVLEAKQASVSLLQRRMRIGYTRAARLIDAMEAKGVVGPYEGSKPREVLVSMEQYFHNRVPS